MIDADDRRLVSAWPARGGPVVHEGVVYFGAGLFTPTGIYVLAVDAASGVPKRGILIFHLLEIFQRQLTLAPFFKTLGRFVGHARRSSAGRRIENKISNTPAAISKSCRPT